MRRSGDFVTSGVTLALPLPQKLFPASYLAKNKKATTEKEPTRYLQHAAIGTILVSYFAFRLYVASDRVLNSISKLGESLLTIFYSRLLLPKGNIVRSREMVERSNQSVTLD